MPGIKTFSITKQQHGSRAASKLISLAGTDNLSPSRVSDYHATSKYYENKNGFHVSLFPAFPFHASLLPLSPSHPLSSSSSSSPPVTYLVSLLSPYLFLFLLDPSRARPLPIILSPLSLTWYTLHSSFSFSFYFFSFLLLYLHLPPFSTFSLLPLVSLSPSSPLLPHPCARPRLFPSSQGSSAPLARKLPLKWVR